MKHHMPQPANGRPIDMLIGQYATGTLPHPMHALVAAHLDLDPAGAAFARKLEITQAVALDEAAPAELGNRDGMLADIFAMPPDAPQPASSRREASDDGVFTPSLRSYLGVDARDVPWRSVLPGVKEWTILDRDGVEAKLYWIKAGRKLPQHTHEGQEVTLVLRGGFTDVSGHYRRGDVAVADSELDHKPVADADEDCICFAVTDAPLRLTGPVGRLLQGMFRH